MLVNLWQGNSSVLYNENLKSLSLQFLNGIYITPNSSTFNRVSIVTRSFCNNNWLPLPTNLIPKKILATSEIASKVSLKCQLLYNTLKSPSKHYLNSQYNIDLLNYPWNMSKWYFRSICVLMHGDQWQHITQGMFLCREYYHLL